MPTWFTKLASRGTNPAAPLVLIFMLAACAETAVLDSTQDDYAAWTSVTVGVADLDVALALWVDQLGFEVAARREGPDSDLARLWKLAQDDIARQALVRTNDNHFGMIHFVEFHDPDPPVRAGAAAFDLVPKNLDIYARDLPDRVQALRSWGATFRTDTHSEVTAPDGTQFREIHMPSHDDINVVLLETLGKELDWNPKGYSGVAPLIFIVPDAGIEKAFFQSAFQLDKLNDNILKGPVIEKMIGLPAGAALDVSIWGKRGISFGGIEIIEYQGVRGTNLYPRAVPKARGILHITYVVRSATGLVERLAAQQVPVTEHGQVQSVVAQGHTFSFSSPAGLGIYVYETDR